MSAYIQLSTPMTDTGCLVGALADVGFSGSSVEVHDEAVPLIGFEGFARARSAHIVVRRRHLGAASNDLGFEQSPTGYQLIVSDSDRLQFGAAWLSRLTERYEIHRAEKDRRIADEERRAAAEERRRVVEATRVSVIEQAKSRGYRVEERMEDGRIRLILSKRVY